MTENVFAPPQAELEARVGPEDLWEMEFKRVKKLAMASINIRVLGVLWGLGAFGVIAGVAMIAMGTGAASGGPDMRGASLGLGAIFLVSGGLSVAACYSAFARPGWGRPLGIVLLVLGLLSFPFGTIIGILGLIAYVQGKRLFGADKLEHKDVMAVYKQRKKDKK